MDSVKCKYCGKLHNNKIFCNRDCKAKWQSTQIPWNKGLKASEAFKSKVSIATRDAMKNIILPQTGKERSLKTKKILSEKARKYYKKHSHPSKGITYDMKYGDKSHIYKERNRINGMKSILNGNNNDTKIERLIENQLLFRNILYIKQYPYKLGVADFWLPETNTIIECDGDYWHDYPNGKPNDARQTEWLENNDYKVVRLWEHDIKNDIERCLSWIV